MKQYNEGVRSKLYNYFSQKFGTLKKSTGNWLRCDCTFCGGYNSMGLNFQSYKVHCFKCGIETSPVKLLMEMQDFTEYREAWEFLRIQQEYEKYVGVIEKKLEFKEVDLPESYRLITQGVSEIGKYARHYIKGRGFNIEEMEAKGVGYCTRGQYAGYIIFPCYKRNKLVFLQGRRFIQIGPKMKNPEIEEFGIGKTKVIYNSDALFIYNTVYINESITNSLTMGDASCGTLGKTVSEWQLSYLINSPCENFIITLDPDAYKEAILLGMKMTGYKRVKVVLLPEDKDVNDLGKRTTKEFVKATRWQSYNDLLKIKLDLDDKTGSINPHKRERLGISPTRGF